MKERKVELFVQLFCRVQTTIWRKKEKIKKGSTRFFDWVVKETRIGNGFSQPAISFQMNFCFFLVFCVWNRSRYYERKAKNSSCCELWESRGGRLLTNGMCRPKHRLLYPHWKLAANSWRTFSCPVDSLRAPPRSLVLLFLSLASPGFALSFHFRSWNCVLWWKAT